MKINEKNLLGTSNWLRAMVRLTTRPRMGKELILQIAESWYSRAVETRNYGFFGKILKEFREKIKKDAQVRAVDLKKKSGCLFETKSRLGKRRTDS